MSLPLLDHGRQGDHHALTSLAADVIAARPSYAPMVVSGQVAAADWLFRKHLSWSRVARLDGDVVGHVGVKENNRLPDGSLTPEGHDRELCRLMVHPRQQRSGIASTLVDLAVASYGPRLWATVAPDGPSHRLLAARGWVDSHRAWFPDEGTYGLVVCSTEPNAPSAK